MLAAKQDDVSNIHRRWFFARITPGSSKTSYAIMFACAAAVIAVSHIFHLQTDLTSLAVHLPVGLLVVAGLAHLDYFMMRGTPVNKLSKIVHVTLFANALWMVTVLVGILASALFGKPGTTDYIVAGMLLAAGLRVGIFTSVFGAGIGRAVAICLVQPLLFFLAFVPPASYGILFDPVGLGFGTLYVALAIAWSAMADRAGRPDIQSTFRLLQAFLNAWTENKPDKMEEYIESRAHDESVSTKIIRFSSGAGRESFVILPDIHPGPFGSVGGSNLPYVLHEHFGMTALVMHSVSDHSLNIPSKKEVERYVGGLAGAKVQAKGGTCSLPVQHRQGSATATAIVFGRTALVMLSLAPKGMEDVPQDVLKELESHASGLGLDLLLVDCHNAMGGQIDGQDRGDLLGAAVKCLDEASKGMQSEFSVGFASLADVKHDFVDAPEFGQAGLAVMVISTQDKKYSIGWADSNNMDNALRDKVVARISDTTMLEMCSSDTHSTSGKRTSEGYFALGMASSQDDIAGAYVEMCKIAEERAAACTYEISSAKSCVKVMGEKQFQDYSGALDRSMNITKVFVAITTAAFIAMQVLA
jgi:putative membrane protein